MNLKFLIRNLSFPEHKSCSKASHLKSAPQKKKLRLSMIGILTCLVLSGCGSSDASPMDGGAESHPAAESQEPGQTGSEGQQSGQDQGSASENNTASPQPDDGYPRGNRIAEQTFDVTLRPLGQVTFAAYEPDTSENLFADVVFLIEREGEILMQLSGTTEDNVGLEPFCQVEAVSFLDYNNDSYDDIIAIVSYYLGAGPQAATPHSLIRYYSGTADGGFVYEAQMSDNASMALAEITVRTARDFISGGRGNDTEGKDPEEIENTEPWQQAYLRYLANDSQSDAQSGYTLICLSNDEIPQLVEVGIDEATGCRIIQYAGGEVHVNQLSRLYFSYIPGSNLLCNSEGNMDFYYDLVYRLEGGELVLAEAGYYGAEDNSRVQFDEEGNPIYQYEWNGTKMSEEEYQEALSGAYDFSKAVSYDFDDLYSPDEIKIAIAEYMAP